MFSKTKTKQNVEDLSRGTRSIISRLHNKGESPAEIKKYLKEKKKEAPPHVSTIRAYLNKGKGKGKGKSKGKKTKANGKGKTKVTKKKIPGFSRVIQGPKKVELTCPKGEKVNVKKEASGKILVTCEASA